MDNEFSALKKKDASDTLMENMLLTWLWFWAVKVIGLGVSIFRAIMVFCRIFTLTVLQIRRGERDKFSYYSFKTYAVTHH